jgi:hypothetical protein
MLDTREAAALAALLEKLAARHPDDPLTNTAVTAAAVIRQRLTGTQPHDPAARRDAGDARDTVATECDGVAAERDREADHRDVAACQRDGQARTASQHADTAERELLDLLWEADRRDRAAAHHAAATPVTYGSWQQQHELDGEMAATDRILNHKNRQAMRDLLARLRETRLRIQRDRYAAARDRQAAARDRQAAHADRERAAHDRQASQSDRDQNLLDTQLTRPNP